MKVALVHDYLNQMGGAERVVLTLHEIFPQAPIYTSIYDPKRVDTAFRPGLKVRENAQVVPQGPKQVSSAQEVERDFHRAGRFGHSASIQTSSRLLQDTTGEDGARLGPDLAKPGKEATDIYLVESVLLPSKVIKKGFETVVIITKAGTTVTGLLAEERTDAVVLRDAAQDGRPITILKKDIDGRNDKGQSLMPEGLLKDYTDQQVRNLFAYLRSTQPLNE